MIFEPKIFYKTYLEDYHKYKILLFKKVLEDTDRFEKELFGQELPEEDKDAFRRTIKSDLRQTYFHAIESFFELFFAISPHGKKTFDDENVLFTLTNARWTVNYEKIIKIASEETSLDFLDDEISFNGYTISIGHYIFYFGLFDKQKLGEEFYQKVSESVDAIKTGIQIIARDFSDREEYNSYKHGLRIIPAVSKLSVVAVEDPTKSLSFDLNDSMSFYCKTKDEQELKVRTKILDPTRDIGMAYFCSNLISNIIAPRKAAFFKQKAVAADKIALGMFGKKEIEDCSKTNVQLQDLAYSVKPSKDQA